MLLCTRAPELSVLSSTASDQKGLTPTGITPATDCPPPPLAGWAATVRGTTTGRPLAKTDFVWATKCAENGGACIFV